MDRWTRAARLISDFSAPPVLAVPTYTIVALEEFSYRHATGFDLLIYLFFGITFSTTLPTLFILFLYSRKIVSDLHITIREQRYLPYLFTIVSNVVGFSFLYWLVGPGVLTAVMLTNIVNGSIVFLINFYWKISAHALGVGMPMAVLSLLFGWVVLPFFLLFPLVGWARLHLRVHTWRQVIVGSLLGFLLTVGVLTFCSLGLGWF